MRYNELNEQDKIQYIKDGFVLILEQLAKDPSKLNNYIKVPDKAKPIKAVVERVVDTMTDEEKTIVLERNKLANEKADAENAKLEATHKAVQEHYSKVESVVSKLEKKPGCMCGSCINLNITSSVIPPELEVLIDAARKEAEERVY